MKTLVWLLLALSAFAFTGVDEAAARPRSPREQCRLNVRNNYKRCIRARTHGFTCFKQRSAGYKHCRRTLPPTNPAQPQRVQPRR